MLLVILWTSQGVKRITKLCSRIQSLNYSKTSKICSSCCIICYLLGVLPQSLLFAVPIFYKINPKQHSQGVNSPVFSLLQHYQLNDFLDWSQTFSSNQLTMFQQTPTVQKNLPSPVNFGEVRPKACVRITKNGQQNNAHAIAHFKLYLLVLQSWDFTTIPSL